MVSFNRRFSSLISKLKFHLDKLNGPKSFIYTCNAGYIPDDHWTQDIKQGGGRLLGEACHFVDLLRFLVGSSISNIFVEFASDSKPCPDTFTINLSFADGSIGTIHYFSNGSKDYPKAPGSLLFWNIST